MQKQINKWIQILYALTFNLFFMQIIAGFVAFKYRYCEETFAIIRYILNLQANLFFLALLLRILLRKKQVSKYDKLAVNTATAYLVTTFISLPFAASFYSYKYTEPLSGIPEYGATPFSDFYPPPKNAFLLENPANYATLHIVLISVSLGYLIYLYYNFHKDKVTFNKKLTLGTIVSCAFVYFVLIAVKVWG